MLLGAGASADASLPLTHLAEKLVRRSNETDTPVFGLRSNWVSALNFVYGSMVGPQAEDGNS